LGLLDQFSKTPLVQRQMKKDGWKFDLRMRTHGEEDLSSRRHPLRPCRVRAPDLRSLSDMAGETLGKGASAHVKAQAKKLVAAKGPQIMPQIAKMHFRTAKEVLGLPVEEKKDWRLFRRSKET
jgi:ribonuclease HIII